MCRNYGQYPVVWQYEYSFNPSRSTNIVGRVRPPLFRPVDCAGLHAVGGAERCCGGDRVD